MQQSIVSNSYVLSNSYVHTFRATKTVQSFGQLLAQLAIHLAHKLWYVCRLVVAVILLLLLQVACGMWHVADHIHTIYIYLYICIVHK